MNGIEGRVQVVLGDRFLQIGHGAERQSAAAIFVAGDHVHRNVPCGRIVLQAVENRPARHVGQVDIERDGAGSEFAREAQRRAAAKRNQNLDAPVVREIHEDSGKGDVILDDQQNRIAGVNQIPVVVDFDVVHHQCRGAGRRRQNDIDRFAVRRDHAFNERQTRTVIRARYGALHVGPDAGYLRDPRLRQIQGERAAHAGCALQTNLATQQPGQFAADGKPQTRAAVLAAGGSIRLLERLEDDSLLVLRNSDAGIGDGERDNRFHAIEHRMIRAPARRGPFDLQPYRAVFREFQGVRQADS